MHFYLDLVDFQNSRCICIKLCMKLHQAKFLMLHFCGFFSTDKFLQVALDMFNTNLTL